MGLKSYLKTKSIGDINVNEVIMLHKVEPVEILQGIVEESIPLNMSCFCAGRWQVSRVLVTQVRADTFDVKVSPRKKSRPISLRTDQAVGISFKYEFDKDTFIFDTKVVAIKSSSAAIENERIVLSVPEQIELIQKRSFSRVKVPAAMQVDVELWHRSFPDGQGSVSAQVTQGFKGRLVDISAGSLLVAIDRSQGPVLEKEQFLGLKFGSLPHETPLRFNAYIRSILHSADAETLLLGLEMVGLEASAEGRLILQRLCSVVEQYRQINEAACEQQNAQTTNSQKQSI